MQDQVTGPRQPYLPPELHQTVYRVYYHHAVAVFVKCGMLKLQQPRYGKLSEDSREKVRGCGVSNISNRLTHLGFPRIFPKRLLCREGWQSFPNVNQGKVPDYTLDTTHSIQGQWL